MLTGPEIIRQVRLGNIVIDPFDESLVGPNSVDVRLGDTVAVYGEAPDEEGGRAAWGYDTRKPPPPLVRMPITEHGMWLERGRGYLSSIVERVGCPGHARQGFVPLMSGKSGLGRLFVTVHQTAGFGDDGFLAQWTAEIISHERPVKVYPGMRIAQICFFRTEGARSPYRGKYQGQEGPTGSRLWMEGKS